MSFVMVTSVQDALKKLKFFREQNIRDSVSVVSFWERGLNTYFHRLGDEKFIVLEQIYIASLDCHRYDIAYLCMAPLLKAFPGSNRIRMLGVLKLEAISRYSDAMDVLNQMIREDPTNAAARKRRVAILKAEGHTADAVKELTNYLKKFMSDEDGWLELCNIYLSEHEYSRACFCMEELILYNPHNHLYHQRLADIKYTQGGLENIEIAASYYSYSLKLSSKNLRSMFGLLLCSKHMLAHAKLPEKKKRAIKLMEWVTECIKRKFESMPGIVDIEPVKPKAPTTIRSQDEETELITDEDEDNDDDDDDDDDDNDDDDDDTE